MILDNPVLLKLHRRYSKDETVNFLFKEIEQLKLKIGELKSDNSELQDNLSSATKELALLNKKKPNQNQKVAKEWNKEEYVLLLKNQLSQQAKQKQKLQKELEEWRNKAILLQLKNENYNPQGTQ